MMLAFLSITLGDAIAEDKANGPMTMAILDFASPDGDPKSQGAEAAALLSSLLSSTENLVLVERAELDKILSELELSVSGTVTEGSAARVGQLTGAQILVTGRMFSGGDDRHLVSKVISTETGRVFGQTAQYEQGESFAGAVEALAEKISITVKEHRADLLPVEAKEDRVARLKGLVAGKKLPKVYVRIAEQILTRSVPDPAAETEILFTLQEVGFPLADTSEGADVVITGEAFGELAGRRANLVSCRARVEVKIQRKSSAGSLTVDRQTSVAVDLAENIAAKSALQEAGRQIAERLVVSLVK